MTNEAMLETLWNDYHEAIRAFVRNYVYDPDAVDDLLSSIYLRATVAISNGNGYTTSARGWIYQIARSAITDFWRAKKRAVFVGLDDIAETVDSDMQPCEQVEQTLLLERVRKAVAQLSEPQAMVTTWRLCGFEYDEIAQGMDKSYGAVKAIQIRAYVNLRNMLLEEAA